MEVAPAARTAAVAALIVVAMSSAPATAGPSRLIQANSKLQRLGAWRIDVSPTLGAAKSAFSRPTSCRRGKTPCTYDQMPVSVVTVTGRQWHTSLGLRIGDSTRRLRTLYPRAPFHAASRGEASPASSYWLVTRRADCLGDSTARRITAPQLVAHTHAGRVVALIFPVGAQGE